MGILESAIILVALTAAIVGICAVGCFVADKIIDRMLS